jgi:hypothetical protein
MIMEEPFYLGAYWGARQEPVDVCAQRLADCLVRLEQCDAALAGWSTKQHRRGDSVQFDGADLDVLRGLLVAGTNHRDADGSSIDELGFSVGLWNGDGERPIGLSITCGAWTTTAGVMNSVVLDLPPWSRTRHERLFEIDTARCVISAVVESWRPNWATLTSYELADALDAPPRVPSVGWFTFLAEGRPIPDTLPLARREDVSGGVLLISADRVEDADVRRISSLADALRKAGSLIPAE